MAIVVVQEENEPAPKPRVVTPASVTRATADALPLAAYLAEKRAKQAAYMRAYRARMKDKT